MMKRRIIAGAVTFVLVLFGVMALGQKNMEKALKDNPLRTDRLIDQLSRLDRLYRNASRQVEEYDTGDESADTLLWSREKSGREALAMLKGLLSDRKALSQIPDMKDLAYQGRVRGWSFVVPEDENGYETILQVGGQIGWRYPEVQSFLEEEVSRALKAGFFPEACHLVQRNAKLKGDPTGVRKYLEEVLPLFGAVPERYLLQMNLLEIDYDSLFEDKGEAVSEGRAEAWIAKSDSLDARLEALREPFKDNGFDYAEALSGIELDRMYMPFLDARMTDLEAGKAEVSLSGIAKGDWSVFLDGREVKILHVPTKKLLTDREELEVQAVKRHSVVLKKKGDSEAWITVYLENGKVDVDKYDSTDGSYLLAYALTDGHPLSGVKATVHSTQRRGSKVLGSVTTGADGKALIEPRPAEGEAYRVTVSHPDMIGERTFYIYGAHKARPAEAEKWEDELLFYPDRSIYRRGQTIKVGLVYRSVNHRGGARLLKQKEGTVTLFAMVNGDEVAVDKVRFSTDDNGVAQIAFDLPRDAAYADYSLRSDAGDYESIQVEDYKLSYLSVRIDSIPTGYTENRVMRVYGRTTDLNRHGVPADVELSFDNHGMKRFSVKSDSEGRFFFETKPLEASWGTSATVQATDALGHIATDNRYLKMHRVSLPLSPSAMARPFEKKAITLSTKNQPYQGLPLGDLSRYRIKASLVDEKGQVYPLGELPLKGEKTFSNPDLPSGSYRLRLESTDYFGAAIREEAGGIYIYDDKDERFSGDTVLFAHKADDRTLLLASSKPIFAHISYGGKGGALSLEVKKLEAGKMYRLPITAERSVKSVFAVWEGRTYRSYPFGRRDEEKGNPDSGVKIEILGLTDSLTFRPGDRFSREVQVTDSLGNPAPLGIPVLVSVYDIALDDAGGELLWPSAAVREISDAIFRDAMGGMLFGASVRGAAEMQLLKLSEETVVTANAAPKSEKSPVRKNFVENAYFSALLRTDMEGKVKLDFKLPDTRTTFRAKMYAFWPDLKQDVEGIQSLNVDKPLSIDLSMPRFLRVGDRLSGQARVQSTLGTTGEDALVRISSERGTVVEEKLGLTKNFTGTVPFEILVTDGDSLRLSASVSAGDESDVMERTVPVKPARERYNVAVPITVFGENKVELSLPEVLHRTESPAFVEIFASPLHLLLSELAKAYDPDEKAEDLNLFALSSKYATLAELRRVLEKYPALRATLAEYAKELRTYADEPSFRLARQASPGELSRYYAFLSDGDKVARKMSDYEREILKYASPDGGFYFTKTYPSPSVWLTHILLYNLRSGRDYFSPKMEQVAEDGIGFLRRSLGSKDRRYRDYVGLEMLLYAYDEPRLSSLPVGLQKEYDRQVGDLRTHYQTASPSVLLRYARYAKVFDRKYYPEVVRFIEDRVPFAGSDLERLLLELYLAEDSSSLRPEVVRFLMQLKQGTMWDDPVYLDAVTLLLHVNEPSVIDKDARLTVGNEVHSLTPLERATGHILFPLYNTPGDGRLDLSWTGIKTPVVIGGVRYEVEQPIADITPAGDKLKVYKEVYARRVQDGKSDLVRLTDDKHANAGEEIVVRYLLETQQDLSLVTLIDRRAAGLEPGYDFRGCGTSDRLWWHYSRRDDTDYIFIDYLPKGKHVLELKAVANVGGTFSYGPASVQSYYAPEYAGNSSGGYFSTNPYTE